MGGIENDKLARSFIAKTREAIQQERRRIEHSLRQLDENQVWQRPAPHVNCVGTIVLHLCGNLRQWFLHGFGGEKDVRNRPSEFTSDTPIPKTELFAAFDALIRKIDALLETLPAAELLRGRRIQGYDECDGLTAIYQTVTHLEGHGLQIAYIAHMLVGEQYEPFWKPATKEQGA